MTKSELARLENVSVVTVDAWIKRGCPGRKVGRVWDFDPAEVRRWRTGRKRTGVKTMGQIEAERGEYPDPSEAYIHLTPGEDLASTAVNTAVFVFATWAEKRGHEGLQDLAMKWIGEKYDDPDWSQIEASIAAIMDNQK